MAQSKGSLGSDPDVDYVIVYRFATEDKTTAESDYEKLVKALSNVGLAVTARDGGNSSVLLFVKSASAQRLSKEVYRSRVKDWLHGLRPAAPSEPTPDALKSEPLGDSERLRIVYCLITQPAFEGGAGITPRAGEWACVESIFPLHDEQFNKEWILSWSKSYSIDMNSLTQLKDRYGEKIGFYFAFLQTYFSFLIFPASFGAAVYFLGMEFSWIYAIVNGLWSIVFIEYWARQETDLAVRWGVRGVSKVQHPNPQFQETSEMRDPVTGEMVKNFPVRTRLTRQLLQIPLAILASMLLGGLITLCFSIEVFISEVYNGPGKAGLIYLPTGILTVVMPNLSGMLTSFAKKLNKFENYATADAAEAAMTRKVFVFNFITSYVPILLTAFVYVPFGSLIVPHLDVFNLAVKPFVEHGDKLKASSNHAFQINPGRLRKQVIYFTVTAQVVNFLLEVVVPYIKRQAFVTVKNVQSKRAAANGGDDADVAANDSPDEAAFLKKVRSQSELDVYDVNADLREMVMQFGYLSLFSVVWPLTAVSFLINNWIELRSDAVKICVEMQRPVPWRADTIGPWLDSLGFLAWFGSITSAALVFLFSGDALGPEGTPWNVKTWALLLTIFFSEHIYFTTRIAVRNILSKFDSPGQIAEQRERFTMRKKYLEQTFGEDSVDKVSQNEKSVQGIDRSAVEDNVRQASLSASGPGDKFWMRQQSWQETAKIGAGIIRRAAPEKKKDK